MNFGDWLHKKIIKQKKIKWKIKKYGELCWDWILVFQ